MSNSVENNGWNEHKLAVYGKIDDLKEDIKCHAKINEGQYEILNRIVVSVEEIKGELNLYKYKISALSAGISAIIAFLMKHFG